MEVEVMGAILELPDNATNGQIAAAALAYKNSVSSAEEAPQTFATSPAGQTYLSQDRPIRRALSDIYTPVLKMAGGVGAGLLSAPTAAATGPLAPAVEGASFTGGYAAGGAAANALDVATGLAKPKPASGLLSQTAGDAHEGAMMYGTGKIGEAVIPEVAKVLMPSKFGEPTPVPVAANVDKAIDHGIDKAIRPSVVTARQPGFRAKSREAIKAIAENKDNLRLTDANGNLAAGRLPETLNETLQALQQTKDGIYQQYDALTMAATGKGAAVPLRPAIQELSAMRKSAPLQDMRSSTVAHIDTLIDKLASRGAYTAKEAQDAIRIANESLEAFYRNPTPEYASTAAADVVVANNIRRSLDKTIEESVGAGYQSLKSRYGAMKSIELDLKNRIPVNDRRNIHGFFDLSDMYTGAEVMNALLTANPASAARAAGGIIAKVRIKMANDPDNIIRKMFQKVGEGHRAPAPPQQWETGTPYDNMGPQVPYDQRWRDSVDGVGTPYRNRQTGFVGETTRPPPNRSGLVEGFQGPTEAEVLAERWSKVGEDFDPLQRAARLAGVHPEPGMGTSYIGDVIPNIPASEQKILQAVRIKTKDFAIPVRLTPEEQAVVEKVLKAARGPKAIPKHAAPRNIGLLLPRK